MLSATPFVICAEIPCSHSRSVWMKVGEISPNPGLVVAANHLTASQLRTRVPHGVLYM